MRILHARSQSQYPGHRTWSHLHHRRTGVVTSKADSELLTRFAAGDAPGTMPTLDSLQQRHISHDRTLGTHSSPLGYWRLPEEPPASSCTTLNFSPGNKARPGFTQLYLYEPASRAIPSHMAAPALSAVAATDGSTKDLAVVRNGVQAS
jgi:hypothetical protein